MRLAVVVQRYGKEVIGGAETCARELATRWTTRHDVEVVTTCAKDHRTWANEYPPGTHTLDDVTVHRYPVLRRRHWRWFGWQSGRLWAKPKPTLQDQWAWVRSQGPESPGIVDWLTQHRDGPDLVVFFTYLYYPTFLGLPTVAERAILVPTAHDEPAIRLPIFRMLFHLPRYLVFLTEEERAFVQSYFRNRHVPSAVVGMGVDLKPADGGGDDGYLLYMGRIEAGKGCTELFAAARELGAPLVAVGPAQFGPPRGLDYRGVVSEEEKHRLIARCRAVIVPSPHESLSLAILEAWSWGKPVVAFGGNPVLRGQIERSGGGYCYGTLREIPGIVGQIDPLSGQRGRDWLARNYTWEAVLDRWERIFAAVHAHASECGDLAR